MHKHKTSKKYYNNIQMCPLFHDGQYIKRHIKMVKNLVFDHLAWWFYFLIPEQSNIICQWQDQACLMNRATKRSLICLKNWNQKRKRKDSEFSHDQWTCDVQRYSQKSKE